MFLIDKVISAEIEVKKSKFIAYLAPFAEFENLSKALKNEHPKAAHIVYAYRYINDFEQIVENSSDNGEPKGSSAPALLNALRGAELVNSACLVVRYFGGVKLGIGGLVRAYGAATNEVINLAKSSAKLLNYEKTSKLCAFVPFSLLSRFEHFVKSQNISFSKEFQNENCKIIFNVNEENKTRILEFSKDFNLELG